MSTDAAALVAGDTRPNLIRELEEGAGQREREATALEQNAAELRDEAERLRAAVRALKE